MSPSVKGHEDLPSGGQETCPVAATRSAPWRPLDCPNSYALGALVDDVEQRGLPRDRLARWALSYPW